MLYVDFAEKVPPARKIFNSSKKAIFELKKWKNLITSHRSRQQHIVIANKI